jgi:hypothetical protein
MLAGSCSISRQILAGAAAEPQQAGSKEGADLTEVRGEALGNGGIRYPSGAGIVPHVKDTRIGSKW